jgi:D-alanyl-D-alanine carboxypeptidase
MRNQKLRRHHNFWNAIIVLFIVLNIGIWSWYVFNKKQLFDKDFVNCTQVVATIVTYKPSFSSPICGEKRIKTFLETLFNTDLKTLKAKTELQSVLREFNTLLESTSKTITIKKELIIEAGFTVDTPEQTISQIPYDDIVYLKNIQKLLELTIIDIEAELEKKVSSTQKQINNLLFLVEKGSELKSITEQLSAFQADKSSTKIKQNLKLTELTILTPQLLLTQAKNNQLWNGEDGDNFLRHRYFTDDDFKDYLTKLDFEKLFPTAPIISTSGTITSLPAVDTYIQAFGQKRGYIVRKTIEPSGLLPLEDFSFFNQGVEYYNSMKSEARKEGVSFVISSGFRDFEAQKKLWQEQYNSVANTLLGRIPEDSQILSSGVDEVLDKTMARVAAPGFSRHHTGMAIDLNDEFTSKPFDQTPAFAWLSKNNYLNAKKFGFMPSYPKVEIDIKFGPNPESWEYVFVGENSSKLY